MEKENKPKTKSLIERIKLFLVRNKNKQKTFIYCQCGNEICSDGSFVSDTYDENNDNHVRYKCKKCGNFRPLIDFLRGETCIDGYFKICKNCRKQELETYIV